MKHTTTFILLSILLLSACGGSTTQENTEAMTTQPLNFSQYNNLKLGFTTQNFIEVVPVSLENAKQFIDYAAEQGFAWIELRDPEATLSVEESQQIADYAKEKNIEVSYAIQKGILDQDFWPTFEKGVKNAAVFEGPKTYRTLIAGQEFTSDTTKLGWTEEELQKLVQYADSAAALAHENGLQYVVENSNEAFFGKEGEYYGLNDFLSRVSDQVGWQFDTANPFSGSRVQPSPDSAKVFLLENADNLHYIHLKAAQNGAAQPVLMQNPVDFATVFQVMNEHNVPYVAIELQAATDKDQAYQKYRREREIFAAARIYF